jgi:branched-chain amino acid transport system ATP-binding protein
MSLTVEHLDAGYGGTQVLRDVTLVVPTGTVVALLGPNGAGKTTLLRACAGLLAPTRGRILLAGDDVTGSEPHDLVRRGVCLVPEGRAVFPTLTVRENLRLFSDRATDTVDRAVTAFPLLARKVNQIAGTLSGGEQQMVALARAYLVEPSYVLLDEVSMGLAPKIVDEIFESLHVLTRTGTAMLLVEQYVHKALDMADLVYVLTKGSVSFAGEAAETDPDTLAASYLGAVVS